jgi:hypothetical protein
MKILIDNQKVTLVGFGSDFDPKNIRNIWTEKGKYCVDWCKRDGCLLLTEEGDDSIYSPYFSTLETVETYGEEAVRLAEFPCDLAQLQEMLDSVTWCNGTVYCRVCDDSFDDHNECCHLHWDDNIGCHLGCGDSEHSKDNWDKIYKDGIFKVFNYFGKDNLPIFKQYLEREDYYIHVVDGRLGYIMSDIPELQGCLQSKTSDFEVDEDMEVAVLWLKSLEKCVTTEAEIKTIAWIDEYLEHLITKGIDHVK